MACSNLNSGFILDCNDSNGGIDKVFIANGPVQSIATVSGNTGIVDEIVVGGSPLVPSDFFEFEVPRQTSSFTETHTVSQANGTLFYEQSLSMLFNKMEANKRNQLLLMGQANNMVCVFKDNNGKYWSVGLERGAYMSAGTSVSGTAYADQNGYQITISGAEAQPSFEVLGSIVEA
jgi:hypothetical protein